MFDWISATDYIPYWYNILLVLCIVVTFHSLSFNIQNKGRLYELSAFGNILFVFVILYMGLRPVSFHFGDMVLYNISYQEYQAGKPFENYKDLLFEMLIYSCSKVMEAKYFFLLVDVLYITPMYLFAKKHFKSYWFFCFFMLLTSFSFWTYGTNGLRNGLATSFFIWGLVYYKNNQYLMWLFFIAGFFMHKSLAIPIGAFGVAYLLRNRPDIILGSWIAAIPISLVSGGFWENLFGKIGLFDDRSEGYLTGSEQYMDQFSATGFRWDFVAYSGIAIFAGWYFIIDRKLNDKFYNQLFGIYAVANTFWILVIRAAFSNRFAYLSWFLMAPVIIYPLCKYDIIKNQYRTIGTIIFLYYCFTYYMNLAFF